MNEGFTGGVPKPKGTFSENGAIRIEKEGNEEYYKQRIGKEKLQPGAFQIGEPATIFINSDFDNNPYIKEMAQAIAPSASEQRHMLVAVLDEKMSVLNDSDSTAELSERNRLRDIKEILINLSISPEGDTFDPEIEGYLIDLYSELATYSSVLSTKLESEQNRMERQMIAGKIDLIAQAIDAWQNFMVLNFPARDNRSDNQKIIDAYKNHNARVSANQS